MLRILILTFLTMGSADQRASTPQCRAEPGRLAERLQGALKRGDEFARTTPAGWVLTLRPLADGWFLQVTVKGREKEDLARLTPPWHFVPNPREIEGWHFRNAENTGPNDGGVNAPQELREFIFSPSVGRDIEYHGSGTSKDEVDKVRAFGRGWLFIERYTLTPTARGTRAAFETMAFSACLTWPRDSRMEPTAQN
jgi:hypothetical protein